MFVVFLAFLFFVLSPGILVVLPIKGYKLVVVAAAHAVIFATIYHFTHRWYTSEGFDTWVQMPDNGWSKDGGITTTYCPAPGKFSLGPPAGCVAPQPEIPAGMSGVPPTCPAGKIFYGGMAKCANVVGPSLATMSEPICLNGNFDGVTNMCLIPTSPAATAPVASVPVASAPVASVPVPVGECPPGCAPIHTNECEDTCSNECCN